MFRAKRTASDCAGRCLCADAWHLLDVRSATPRASESSAVVAESAGELFFFGFFALPTHAAQAREREGGALGMREGSTIYSSVNPVALPMPVLVLIRSGGQISLTRCYLGWRACHSCARPQSPKAADVWNTFLGFGIKKVRPRHSRYRLNVSRIRSGF